MPSSLSLGWHGLFPILLGLWLRDGRFCCALEKGSCCGGLFLVLSTGPYGWKGMKELPIIMQNQHTRFSEEQRIGVTCGP